MKKKIAMLLCAAMVLALAGCGDKNKTPDNSQPVTVTATPTPGQKKTVTATPTATPTPKKDWVLQPTFTPKPTPTMTPEQLAEEAAKLAAAQFNKTYALDLSKAVKANGELPAISADGIAAKGGVTQKFIIPLDVQIVKNKKAVVTVTMKFNSAADTQIRVYGIKDTADNALTTIGYIKNPGHSNEFTTSAVIIANDDYNALLVASSGWGVMIDDIEIKKITVAPDPKVDLTTLAAINGDAPTVDKNGNIVAKGGVSQKFAFPLGETYHTGDVLAVTVTGKFNSNNDDAIRLYTIQGANDSAKSVVEKLLNAKDGKTFAKTAVVNVTDDCDHLLVASSGYGVMMNDILISSISVKKAEVIDLKAVYGINGDAPIINDDGTLSVKALGNKFAFPVTSTDLTKGSNVTAVVTGKFNSADDTSVRLYTIVDANDSACSSPVHVNNPGTKDLSSISVNFTQNTNANALLVAGSAWGVTMNDITIQKIVLFETPVVEEPVVDTTPKTGDSSMIFMIVLLGMAAVSGVVFFKKREEVR